MKKFMMGAKATLGMAGKVEDDEYDKYHASARGLEMAVTAYQQAAKAMESAAKDMTAALQKMSKAFSNFSEGDSSIVSTKNTADAMRDVAETVENHYFKLYKEALGNDHLKDLLEAISEEKKLGDPRNKKMTEYVVQRDLIAKKEEEYTAKNKPLDESKKYKEMVADRDTKKEEFEAANAEYKAHCKKMFEDRETLVNKVLVGFLDSSSLFLSNVEKDLAECAKKAK